ncbi:TRAP transporter small permease [Rhizobium sp. SSA_523]|uniref:TRAP transporter small permease n=1 Tax=Rhizobium sp. SSA_523 TaxID=2952477 RepID=UPI00209122B4|nr:TRAP transporter small permease [Rhizobium sp. SSA_523]MCO5733365.1 TRAP transporter small permease [Rhizobium sp. SSA_523]WKC21658.1 TRAP transporter small permease [Rhizobium sp. SSA_523]
MRYVDWLFRLFEIALVILLGCMVVMVFGNVVLRYGFNSGITVSEELSRFAFIWLAFLGTVVGFRDRAHLGADFLVSALPPLGRKICFVICSLLIIWSCSLIFIGTLRGHSINMQNYSPVMGLPMEYIYASAYVLSIGIIALTVARLYEFAKGRIRNEDLFGAIDAEEALAIEAAAAGKTGSTSGGMHSQEKNP